MMERVIFAGGGTGGHLFPAIAVMEELRRREPELDVLFVGTARGIETKVVPQLGERLTCLEVSPLKGRSPTQLVKSLATLPAAGLEAARVVRNFRPSLVIGVGGYAAGPMVLAARTLGVPSALLEQNAHVGLTNRLLSHVVQRAYLSFDETAAQFPERAVRVFGNPVRRAFVAAGTMARMDPLGFEMRARRVLVVGGSQGAKVLNQVVPEALARAGLGERGTEIVHQTGHAMCEEVSAHYARLGLRAEVTPFIEDMARAYASASLVIGRAGATSLAEICAVGRPSLLIPFPHAADDHQWHNARALAARGAAIALREPGLEVGDLAQRIAELMAEPARRTAMAEAARALGRPDAAAAIVDDLCEWLGCASAEETRDDPEGPTREGDDLGEVDVSTRKQELSLERAFPPDASERRAMSRRRARRRSLAWSHTDLYYGTRAIAALE
jgi:UDP-N-acetylglucosamine--N-acetylmuramyl-(pentapeptide) pyrophosphoryl-undecaprenol N-acetylglucosamine transferase